MHTVTVTETQLVGHTFNFTRSEIVTQLAAPSSRCHVDFDASTCVKDCEQLQDDCQHVDTFSYSCPSAEYMTGFALCHRASVCQNFMFSLSVCVCVRERHREHGGRRGGGGGGRWRVGRLKNAVANSLSGSEWGTERILLRRKAVTARCTETSSVCKHDCLMEMFFFSFKRNKAMEIHMRVSLFM